MTATLLTTHTLSAQTDDPEKWTGRGHEMRWIFTGTQGTFAVDFLRRKILVSRFEPYPAGATGTRVVYERVEDFAATGDAFFHDITAMRQDFIRRCHAGERPCRSRRRNRLR